MVNLAIVIPYYKIIYFEDTLKSLVGQTDNRFNVYIGDDASPEDPSALLKKHETQLNLKYQRFDENFGSKSLVKQWERCIGLTDKEEWIMILGDDDYLSNNVVESWYKHYNTFASKSNLIRFATKLVYQNSQTLSGAYTHPIWEHAKDSYWRKFNHLTRSSLSEYFFSRETYDKYKFQNFPLAWNSDDCAWLDFSDYKPIYTINDSLVFVGFSESNISGKQDNIDPKRNSQIAFYKYIISKKAAIFNKQELLLLMRKYEIEILRQRPLKKSEWLYLFLKYLIFFDYKAIKKFMKRFLKTILKRNEY